MHESHVETFLRSANAVRGFAGVTRAMCWGAAALVAACLFAIACDATFTLPVWSRLIVDVILLVAGLGLAFGLWRTARSFRFNRRKSARDVELMLDIDDNAFINAVDLEEAGENRTSSALRKHAVEQGLTLSQRLSFLEAVRFGPMLVSCLALLVLGIATIATFFVNPALFTRVIPRYLDVFGNHPAYTSLAFDVQTAPERIYQGQSAIVNVTIDGVWLPDNANFVQLDGDQRISTPMLDTEPGAFQLELDDLQETVEFCIETDTGTSDRFTLEVVAVPLFENVWLNYNYPTYTQWKPKRQLLDARGITAIQGTQVSVEVESNLELAGGELKTSSKSSSQPKAEVSLDERAALVPKDETPRIVNGQLKLSDQSWFEISIKAVNGSSSPEPLSGRVVASPDRRPQIHFSKPDPHIIAVEGWEIPVQIQLSDDVGLGELTLFRSVNGLGPYPKPLAGDQIGQTTGQAQYQFDLADLGAKAGDLITYYATVSDNYPTDWPDSEDHISSTDTFVIQVISLEQYQELARQNYRMDDVLDEMEQMKEDLEELKEQRDEALDALEQLQDKLESGEELTEAEQQQLDELKKQLQEFAEATEALAERLQGRAEQAAIYDFEESYQEKLKELADQLQQQSENAEELAKQLESGESPKSPNSKSPNSKSPNSESLRDAMKMFRDSDKPFDSDSEQKRKDLESDMEQLAGAEQMLQSIAEMKSVIEQQRLIADRMKEFSKQAELTEPQQQRLKQLSKQQDLLKQDLERAMENMELAAENAREAFPKGSQSLLDMVEAINESGVLDDQQQATDSGQGGEGKQAHEAAEEAAKKLEALQCDCNGKSMGQEMAQGDQPLSIPKDSMCDSLQQLAQSMQCPSLKPGKQGGSGAGYRGSMAKATLFGPHQPSDSRSQAQRGGGRRSGKGRGTGSGLVNESIAAENLTPEARSGQTSGPTNMRGVPSQYIDHARGYLKRIAEDPSTTATRSESPNQSNNQ